jgi:hypothetical protein
VLEEWMKAKMGESKWLGHAIVHVCTQVIQKEERMIHVNHVKQEQWKII